MKITWNNIKFAWLWLLLAGLFLWLAVFTLTHFGYWWRYILSVYAFCQCLIFGTLGFYAIMYL